MLKDKIKTMVEKDEKGCLITCTMLVKKQVFLTSCTRAEEADMVDNMKANIIKELRGDLKDEP